MFLVVGLGNPGPEYAGTRHNAGQLVVSRLAKELRAPFTPDNPDASLARATIDDLATVLAIPKSFVNTSGRPVAGLCQHLAVRADQLIVVHDDIDLEFATLRIKKGGGTGGHRGLDSIAAGMGTLDFIRVRVGVGRPPGKKEPADYVLEPFCKHELPEIEVTLALAAQAVRAVITEGVTVATDRYNKKVRSEEGEVRTDS